MEIDKDYYGEIGFHEDEINCFCVLKKNLDNEVLLITNLIKTKPDQSESIIYGVFSGLGCLTFVENQLVFSETGMITMAKYEPDLTFIGNHFISTPKDFKTNKISIVNPDLRKWIDVNLFDLTSLKKGVLFDKHINHSITIPNALKIDIKTNNIVSSSKDDYSLILTNNSILDIEFIYDNKSVFESIEIYNKFQKFLLFFNESISQFVTFKINCLSCNQEFELIYSDKSIVNKKSSKLKLKYLDLKNEIEEILINWFTDEDLQICIDRILTNLLSNKLSHIQRFINSYISLESFALRFEEKEKTIEKFILKNKILLSNITGIDESSINLHINNIIRTRKYYVHDDMKERKHFQGIELLKEAVSLEYFVIILVFQKLKISNKIIKKTICNAYDIYTRTI